MIDVIQVNDGVAVVADNTWSAMEGRNALQITWDEGANAKNSSEAIRKLYQGRMEQTGVIARKDGDADGAMDMRATMPATPNVSRT